MDISIFMHFIIYTYNNLSSSIAKSWKIYAGFIPRDMKNIVQTKTEMEWFLASMLIIENENKN